MINFGKNFVWYYSIDIYEILNNSKIDYLQEVSFITHFSNLIMDKELEGTVEIKLFK